MRYGYWMAETTGKVIVLIYFGQLDSIYYKTCKDCRGKVKTTKEIRKGQRTQATPFELHKLKQPLTP